MGCLLGLGLGRAPLIHSPPRLNGLWCPLPERVLTYPLVPRGTWLLRPPISISGGVDSTCFSESRRLDSVMLPGAWGSWETQGLMPERHPRATWLMASGQDVAGGCG